MQNESKEPTIEEVNFAVDFVRNMGQFNPYFMNPLLANQNLKDMNMQPLKQTRERVQDMINDPKNNEQSLRRLSQHLYDTQMSYKRMVHYLADILTFDWYPIPINADEKSMKKSTFKSDFNSVCSWFDKFDVKKEFRKAILKMSEEDGYFTYLREDSDGDLFLQEMPIDWCMIDSTWKYGYLYAFNLMYFQQQGADINGFPPEFKGYYNNALDMHNNKTYYPDIKPKMRNGQWMYWQQLKPEKAWVWKFHNHFAGLIPPFLGVFVDLLDIPNLKDVQNAKSELEAYKIIMGTVPRQKDDKSGSSKDNFAIQADTLAQFVQLVKNSLQSKYVDFKAVPLEGLEMFSFDDTANKDNVLMQSLDNLSTQTGLDKNLLNTSNPNVSTMKLSKLIDVAFIERLYSQFADFCTFHANRYKKNSTYKFKIIMEGTIHDKEERQKQAKEDLTLGVVTPKVASGYGMSIKDMQSGMALMKSLGFVEKLTPAETSYTLSSNDKKDSGRPQKEDDDLGDSGTTTRTQGSNIDKEGGGE